MHRLETQWLGGFNDTPIDEPSAFDVVTADGRQLDYEAVIGNTPGVTSAYDGFHQPQLILSYGTSGFEGWDEARHYPVGRLNSIHGRNLEILAKTVSIEDRYGNHYQSLGIKGSDFSEPRLVESDTAVRDFIIHGLQESLVMERVIRASHVLRAAGVETEYICGLVAPEVFPAGRGANGIDEQPSASISKLIEALATRYVVSQKWQLTPRESIAQPVQKPPTALEIKAQMIDKFHDVDYLISYRAMDTPYRLGELSNPHKFNEFCEFILRNNNDPLVEEFLEELHPIIYIVEDVASNFAKNVAKMHNAGISHGFLHANNITALGSIVDLDSCRGEPLDLGDEPTTEVDIYKDVRSSLSSLLKVLTSMEPKDPRKNVLEFGFMQDAKHIATSLFIIKYLAERFDNAAEAATFMAGFIADTFPKYKDDYGGFSRFCEQATAGYVSYIGGIQNLPEISADDLPPITSYDMGFGRRDSLLQAVPARYFKERRDDFLSNRWTMNHEYQALQDNDRPSHNPIKAALRSISLRLFCDHAQQSGFINNAPAFLRAIYYGSSLANVDPDRELTDPSDHLLNSYFVAQTYAIIDRLSDEENQTDQPVVDFLLNKSLGDLKEQTGQLDLGSIIPLLYLNGVAQYERVFAALGLTPDSSIEYIEDEKAMCATQDNPADTILLVDYSTARFIAEKPSKEDIFLNLFGCWRNRTPLMLIQGLMSGEPRIFVVAHPQYENFPLQTSAAQFASASPRDWYPKLFEIPQQSITPR